jgi:hypothetical protein
MPLLRCVDEDCGHEWYEPSRLAEGADCIECGGPTVLMGRDAIEDINATEVEDLESPARPRLAYARQAANALLSRLEMISAIPIPVEEIASRQGLTIRSVPTLGALQARLVGDTIEVAQGSRLVVKRFSIAHEIGHHYMNTAHGEAPGVESEANAFAGELLVPGKRLLEALAKTTDTATLASWFQVSLQVIRIAAENHRKGGVLT